MPEKAEQFLYVRASRAGRTHIGGTFCASDVSMQNLYESIEPCLVQDIDVARLAVAGGLSVVEALYKLNVSDRTLKKVTHCLMEIEYGRCSVFQP